MNHEGQPPSNGANFISGPYKSPIPARQRAALPLNAVGIPDAADAVTQSRSPEPRPLRPPPPGDGPPSPSQGRPRRGPRPPRPRPPPVRPGPVGDHARSRRREPPPPPAPGRSTPPAFTSSTASASP